MTRFPRSSGPEGLYEAGRRGVLRRCAQEPQGRGNRRVCHPGRPQDSVGQAGWDRVEWAQDHADRVQEEEEEVEVCKQVAQKVQDQIQVGLALF